VPGIIFRLSSAESPSPSVVTAKIFIELFSITAKAVAENRRTSSASSAARLNKKNTNKIMVLQFKNFFRARAGKQAKKEARQKKNPIKLHNSLNCGNFAIFNKQQKLANEHFQFFC